MDVWRLPLQGEGGLVDVLSCIPDPRGARGLRYSSVSMLSICVCAMLSGAKSVRAIAEWASTLERKQLRRIGIQEISKCIGIAKFFGSTRWR